MLRPCLKVLPLLGILALPLFGQGQAKNPNSFGTPKFELFTGYSYRRTRMLNPCTVFYSSSCAMQRPAWENAHGWALGLTYNFHPHIGVATDLSAQYQRVFEPSMTLGGALLGYDRDFRATVQLLAGPRFSLRSGRVTQFAHVMLGGYRNVPSSYGADFAMGLGGGVNVDLTKRLSVRAFQADFIPVKEDLLWRGHTRVQTGLVLNFGR